MRSFRNLDSLGAATATALAFNALAGLAFNEAHAQPPQATASTQQGKASYYHHRFNGRRMANGDRFDPSLNTAAHRTLPLGTMVRVTNLDNGRSVVVRVTDRGPFTRGRIIDLSPTTADHLGMRRAGVAQVQVTPLRDLVEIAEARVD
jgi:rare lipoprotein A